MLNIWFLWNSSVLDLCMKYPCKLLLKALYIWEWECRLSPGCPHLLKSDWWGFDCLGSWDVMWGDQSCWRDFSGIKVRSIYLYSPQQPPFQSEKNEKKAKGLQKSIIGSMIWDSKLTKAVIPLSGALVATARLNSSYLSSRCCFANHYIPRNLMTDSNLEASCHVDVGH